MNGYNLIRDWYNFKFENPQKAKAKHSDFYCYLVDQWNRLGQKKQFGLPTSYTMECLGIGSYNTYKDTLNDLVKFGFVKIVSDSKNQHQSKIVALSNFDKAPDKALDKATARATDKAPDTITKPLNKELLNNNTVGSSNEAPQPHKPKRKVFEPPTLEQVQSYCVERSNSVNAQQWIDYYTSNGWMVGKNKMKDWQAAVRTWERNNINNGNNGTKKPTGEDRIQALKNWGAS